MTHSKGSLRTHFWFYEAVYYRFGVIIQNAPFHGAVTHPSTNRVEYGFTFRGNYVLVPITCYHCPEMDFPYVFNRNAVVQRLLKQFNIPGASPTVPP